MCDCPCFSDDDSNWFEDSPVGTEASLSQCNFGYDSRVTESELVSRLERMEGFGWGRRPPSDGNPAEEPGKTSATLSYLVQTAKAKLACRKHEIDEDELRMLARPLNTREKQKVLVWLRTVRDPDEDTLATEDSTTSRGMSLPPVQNDSPPMGPNDDEEEEELQISIVTPKLTYMTSQSSKKYATHSGMMKHTSESDQPRHTINGQYGGMGIGGNAPLDLESNPTSQDVSSNTSAFQSMPLQLPSPASGTTTAPLPSAEGVNGQASEPMRRHPLETEALEAQTKHDGETTESTSCTSRDRQSAVTNDLPGRISTHRQ